MLTEPQTDAALMALDRAVAEAVRDRLAAPAHAHPDAQAITLRQTLTGLTAAQSAAVRAVLGRIDAAQGSPLVVWGPSAQVLAADRFGLSARIAAEPEQALTAVRSGPASSVYLPSKPQPISRRPEPPAPKVTWCCV